MNNSSVSSADDISPRAQTQANEDIPMITSFRRLMTLFGFAFLTSCGGAQSTAEPSTAAGGKHPIGGACSACTDCESGLVCDKGDPGGMCQKKCTTTADCGAGAVCNGEKKCYHACQTKADCREGYACQG